MANFRVTYATLSADNEELHAAYEEGCGWPRAGSAQTIPTVVDGKARYRRRGRSPCTAPTTRRSSWPACTRPPGATSTTPSPPPGPPSRPGRRRPGRSGSALLRGAADLISERSNELAALMSLEVGKNRLEALGDVEESADLIRYYCQQVEDHDGFDRADGPAVGRRADHAQRAAAVRGVGGHQPVQLPDGAGRRAGRRRPRGRQHRRPQAVPPGLVHRGYKLYECFRDAGLPAGRAPPAARRRRGRRWSSPPTGSTGSPSPARYAVGMSIYRQFSSGVPQAGHLRDGRQEPGDRLRHAPTSTWPRTGWRARPSACPGRSARPARGCTWSGPCSRSSSAELAERAGPLVVGDPPRRETYLGPVIDAESVDRFEEAVKRGSHARAGSWPAARCSRTATCPTGYYLAPTVVDRAARPMTGSSATSCSCRWSRWRRTTPWTRRWRWPTTPSSG